MTATSTRVPTADGTTLAVHELAGPSDELVVALHGFTGNGAAMIPLLDACRGDRAGLAVDLVGHGDSDAPDSLEPYSMASVVDQVLSIIGPRPPGAVHLIGYSMGGRIALSMAARAPWYFASITTLSASPGLDDPIERAARYDVDHARADELVAIGVPGFIDDWLRLDLFAPYVASLTPESRATTIAQRTANSATGLANSRRGTGTGSMPPVWNALSSIRSPLLAVAGDLDTRYVEVAHDMADRAPRGRSSVIAGAGHVVHEEKPREVSTLIADFLTSCADERDQ